MKKPKNETTQGTKQDVTPVIVRIPIEPINPEMNITRVCRGGKTFVFPPYEINEADFPLVKDLFTIKETREIDKKEEPNVE